MFLSFLHLCEFSMKVCHKFNFCVIILYIFCKQIKILCIDIKGDLDEK